MARRSTAEVLARNGRGEKQCVRCEEWLPESTFSKMGTSDGLHTRCKRCAADGLHHLPVERRQQILAEQGGMCSCGFVFDVYGGLGVTYDIDHDHGHCPGERSCGECIRELVCRSCNLRDRNNPDRFGYKGSSSKYRGVSWQRKSQKWKVQIQRGGKQFYPTAIGWPCRYLDESEAGRVAAQLEAWLDANPQLWRAA